MFKNLLLSFLVIIIQANQFAEAQLYSLSTYTFYNNGVLRDSFYYSFSGDRVAKQTPVLLLRGPYELYDWEEQSCDTVLRFKAPDVSKPVEGLYRKFDKYGNVLERSDLNGYLVRYEGYYQDTLFSKVYSGAATVPKETFYRIYYPNGGYREDSEPVIGTTFPKNRTIFLKGDRYDSLFFLYYGSSGRYNPSKYFGYTYNDQGLMIMETERWATSGFYNVRRYAYHPNGEYAYRELSKYGEYYRIEGFSHSSALDEEGRLDTIYYRLYNTSGQPDQLYYGKVYHDGLNRPVKIIGLSGNNPGEIMRYDTVLMEYYENTNLVTYKRIVNSTENWISEYYCTYKTTFVETEAVQLYPNPTSGVIVMKNEESGFIQLYDLSGRLVMGATSIQEGERFVLPGYMKSGLYFYRIESEGKIASGKLLVIRE